MFSFNTKTLFLLAKFTQYFKKDIDRILQLAYGDMNDASEILKLVFDLIGVLPEAQDTAIDLLAAAMEKDSSEIRAMDGYEFIKNFRLFLMEVNWDKLMGESLGLGVKKIPAKPDPETLPQTES